MAWLKAGRIHLRSFGLLIVQVMFDAITFVTVFTVYWLVSLCFHFLNTTQRFPPGVYALVGRLEIWLFYMDCTLSGFLFVFTCVKFVIHTLEDA